MCGSAGMACGQRVENLKAVSKNSRNAEVTWNCAPQATLRSSEVRESGGFRIESGDGFDEARHRERIADAPGAAHQSQGSAVARQFDRHTYERRNAGTVDLRHSVEINDHFARPTLDDGLQCAVQLFARLSNRQPAAHIENRDNPGFPDDNFHGGMLGHRTSLENLYLLIRHRPPGQSCGDGGFAARRHYTMVMPPGKDDVVKYRSSVRHPGSSPGLQNSPLSRRIRNMDMAYSNF